MRDNQILEATEFLIEVVSQHPGLKIYTLEAALYPITGVFRALPFLAASETAGMIKTHLGRVYITERGQQLTSANEG